MKDVRENRLDGARGLGVAYALPTCYCSKTVPMLRLTPEGLIDCVNDCFCQVGHFPAKDELLGRFLGDFVVHPEDEDWLHDSLRKMRERKADVLRRECEVYANGGYPVCLDLVLMAKRNGVGILAHIAVILQDISPSKQNERRLMEALKEQERLNKCLGEAHEDMRKSLDRLSIQMEGADIGEMRKKLAEVAEAAELRSRRQTASLAGVSHDIRTPLGAITGFADLLAQGGAPEEKEEYLRVIHDSSRLISELLKGILDLEMLDSGQFRFHNDLVDLKKLGMELCSIHGVVNADHPVKVIFNKDANPDIVFSTDTTQLRRILNNLVSNAVKNTQEGQVVFSYQKKGGFIEFSVSDTGRGIPKDKLRSIFNRYERLRRDYEGFGLGLAICQSLVDTMGGKIWVVSEEGKGAAFHFTLPVKR